MFLSAATPISEAVFGSAIGLIIYLLLNKPTLRGLVSFVGLGAIASYFGSLGCADLHCFYVCVLNAINYTLNIIAAHPIGLAAYSTGFYAGGRLLR